MKSNFLFPVRFHLLLFFCSLFAAPATEAFSKLLACQAHSRLRALLWLFPLFGMLSPIIPLLRSFTALSHCSNVYISVRIILTTLN